MSCRAGSPRLPNWACEPRGGGEFPQEASGSSISAKQEDLGSLHTSVPQASFHSWLGGRYQLRPQDGDQLQGSLYPLIFISLKIWGLTIGGENQHFWIELLKSSLSHGRGKCSYNSYNSQMLKLEIVQLLNESRYIIPSPVLWSPQKSSWTSKCIWVHGVLRKHKRQRSDTFLCKFQVASFMFHGAPPHHPRQCSDVLKTLCTDCSTSAPATSLLNFTASDAILVEF